MKLLIDSANVEQIKHIYEYYPVDGVTTNPSILTKSGREPYAVLREIRGLIGDAAQLHVQVVSRQAEGMVAEGHRIADELGRSTYIKLPVTPEGLKAMMELSYEGYRVTATAIYTPMQAYLAAKAGAAYAAPYVNRIDNLGANGVEAAKRMHDIFRSNGFRTELLAASFQNSQQVLELCTYGVGAATASPEIIGRFLKHDSVSAAVEDFARDFERLCGPGATMLNCAGK